MVGVIIATHGHFADGLVDSAKMFADDIPNIKVLDLTEDKSLDTFTKEVTKAVEEVDTGDGVIALVDILGGCPSTAVFRVKHKQHKNIQIVTGVNLPMIVTFLLISRPLIHGLLNIVINSSLSSYSTLNLDIVNLPFLNVVGALITSASNTT